MRCKVERRVKPMVLHAIWLDSEVPNVGSCYSSTSEVQAKGLDVERSIEAKHFFGIVGFCYNFYDKSMRRCGHVQMHSGMIASGVTIFGVPMFHPSLLFLSSRQVRRFRC